MLVKSRLAEFDAQIELAKFYAQFWLVKASSGACNLKKSYIGSDPEIRRPQTPEEKADDALQTAERHAKRVAELMENRKDYLDKQFLNARIGP